MVCLLLVLRSRPSAWNDGNQPENGSPDLVWHDVNVIVNQDKKQALTGIRVLVGVLGSSPKIAATKVNNDRFEGNLAVFL